MKKYFETKKNSLESAVTGVFGKTIDTMKKTFSDAEQAAKSAGKKFITAGGRQYAVKEDKKQDLNEKKMDKVNPIAVKKKFDDRKDKDIDNDGDVDSSDKYLHKRRKAISKAVKSEITDKQKKLPKKLQAAIMKKEKEDGMKESIVDIQQQKNLSMREMLAKIWGVNEGRSPFEPQKTEQAKAPKTSKTESGQKATKVEINPEIAPVVQTQIVPNSDR